MNKKKFILIIGCVILFLSLASLLFNNYLNTQRVQRFIQDQLPENIELEYAKLNTNIFFGNFSLKDAIVVLKDKGIRIKVDEINLKGLDYTQLLTSDTISITYSEIKKASLLIDKSHIDSTFTPEKKERKNLILKLEEFNVDFSDIEFKNKEGVLKAKIHNTQFGLKDLIVQSKPENPQNDLRFAISNIESDSVMLSLNDTQDINIKHASINSSTFKFVDTQLALKNRGIQMDFDVLEMTGSDLGHVFSEDTIRFEKCVITQGKVKINNAKKETKVAGKQVKSAGKVILIDNFNTIETALDILDERGKPTINFENTNSFFENIKILTNPKEDENHLNYNFIRLTANNLNANMNDLHTFSINDIRITDEKAELGDVRITPNYSRSEFQNHIKEEKDVADLRISKVIVSDYDYSFDKAYKFIKAKRIGLYSPKLSLYRNKLMPDQSARKPLYSEMLRNLDMELAIDKIDIKNAHVTYEEHVYANKKPGKIFFEEMNGSITHLYNKTPSHDLVKINLDTKFMGYAPTRVAWSFHVHAPADHFRIKGSVQNLNANSLDDFLIPNMKAKIDGVIKKTTFDFRGNDIRSKGEMNMVYDDLHVELLNNKNEKKGFWSVLANFFVKSEQDKNPEIDNIVTVERDQKKSFFNYFWLSLKEGIKQNVLKYQGKKSEN